MGIHNERQIQGFAASLSLLLLLIFSGPPVADAAATPPAQRAQTVTTSTPGSGTSATPSAGPPTATATVSERCQKIIDSVAAGKSAAELKIPITNAVREIIQCHAVKLKKESLCNGLPNPGDCRTNYKFWTDARTAKGNWPAVFSKALGAGMCPPSEKGCDKLLAAIAAQDPSKCTAEWNPICTALATADPSHCDKDDGDCHHMATMLKLLKAGGLDLLAKKGTDTDKDFVAAALGRPDACSHAIKTFLAECNAPPAVESSDNTASTTPVAGATPPGTTSGAAPAAPGTPPTQ